MTTHHHAETLRAAADLLAEIGTPVSGTRSEHERGLMYGAERLRRMADETTAEQQKDTPAPAGAAFTAERSALELQALLYEAITRFQTTAMITGLRLPQIRQYLTEHLYIALTGDSAPSLTIYRAEHDTVIAGRYTTQAAARAHCEALISAEYPTDVTLLYDWIEDEEDRVAELVIQVNGGHEFTTGYTVTALDVATSYEEVPEWTAIELLLILASAVAMLWAAVGITDARALRRSRTGLPQQKHLHVGAARADGGRHRRYGGGL